MTRSYIPTSRTSLRRAAHHSGVVTLAKMPGLLILVSILVGFGVLSAVATEPLVPHWSEWRNSLKPQGAPGPEITLARNGTTDYVLVIPADPSSQERKGAEELARWLAEVTGALFPVVPDSQPPQDQEISLGRTKRWEEAELRGKEIDLGDEGYGIDLQGKRIYLWGGERRGPLYAIFALLEEDLGLRWHSASGRALPSDSKWDRPPLRRADARIPSRATLCFNPVPRTFVPPFVWRDPFYYDAFDPVWSLRNRTTSMQCALPTAWGGGVRYAKDLMSTHTFARLVPKGKYWSDHPEYFAMKENKRNPYQLCLTNPEVLRITVERIRESQRRYPDAVVVEVSPNDGGGTCGCPACAALIEANGGRASGALLYFVNQVAEALEPDYPDLLVSTLAYLDTLAPPTRDRPRPNVVIRLCNDLHSWTYALVDFANADHPPSIKYREALADWSKITHHLWVWDYCVNFSHNLAPMPNWRVFDPSTRAYLENGVTGLMWQGNMLGLGTEAGPMRAWVLAKQLWDPSRDVPTLMADFIWGHYGAAAPAMADYFNMVDRKWQEHKNDSGVDALGMRFHPTTPFLSDGYVQEAERILARAEALAAGDEETHARVQLATTPLLYTKLVHALGLQIDPWTLKPNPENWVFKPDRRFVPQPPNREELARVLDEFEQLAWREHILFLAESHHDQPGTHLKAQIAAWREQLSSLPDSP